MAAQAAKDALERQKQLAKAAVIAGTVGYKKAALVD